MWPRDWSSDVCSSDLGSAQAPGRQLAGEGRRRRTHRRGLGRLARTIRGTTRALSVSADTTLKAERTIRSEERRVGKEEDGTLVAAASKDGARKDISDG